MRRVWFVLPLATVMVAGFVMPACATDANNVTGCRELENARCVRAQSCGLDLSTPLHAGDTEADAVTACQLFYQDACLHGLATTVAITNPQLTACLAKIKDTSTSCNYVINPQQEPECSWLNPPDAGVDASDGSVADAGTDVTVVYVYPDAGVDTAPDGAYEACLAPCDSTCSGDPQCITNCESACAGN